METKNSEMELMTEQKEENVKEEGQENSFFRHENEEITINLKSLKEKAAWYWEKIQQKAGRYLIPLKNKFIAKQKLIISAIAILATVMIAAVYFVEHSGYRGELNQIIRVVNKREGDLNVIAQALLPEEIETCYKEVAEIIGDNDYVENILETLEAELDGKYARLDDYFGSDARVSFKVLEKEKMSKSQIRRAEHSYQEYYETYWKKLTEEVDKFDYERIDSIARQLDLPATDVAMVREDIGIVADFLEGINIEKGYNLTLELLVKGAKNRYRTKLELCVITQNRNELRR